MRYFEREELTRRYDRNRPRVHGALVRQLAQLRGLGVVCAALDIACGTGHSTAALRSHAHRVYGCDISSAMLSAAAREADSAQLVYSAGEATPFRDGVFDLATVSMAFHWLDQPRFLREMARILRPGAELWVYNLVFPGILVSDPSFAEWHRRKYLARYPVPKRHATDLSALLESTDQGFVLAATHGHSFEVEFTAEGLRSYLTTQSNIEQALRKGACLTDIDDWLDEELAPFFASQRVPRFSYIARAEIAVRSAAEPRSR